MVAYSGKPALSQAVLKFWRNGKTEILSDGSGFDDFIYTSIRLAQLAILQEIHSFYFCDCISKKQVLKFSALLK